MNWPKNTIRWTLTAIWVGLGSWVLLGSVIGREPVAFLFSFLFVVIGLSFSYSQPPGEEVRVRFLGIAVLAFGALLMLAAVSSFKHTRNRYNLASESVDWPVVEGEIVNSEVVATINLHEVAYEDTRYTPSSRYAYKVGRIDYSSSSIAFGGLEEADSSGPEWALSVVREYPVGSSVGVYYYPADPEIAVSVPGNPPVENCVGHALLALIGIAFTFYGLHLVLNGNA